MLLKDYICLQNTSTVDPPSQGMYWDHLIILITRETKTSGLHCQKLPVANQTAFLEFLLKRTASHGILLIYITRNFRTFLIKSFAFGKCYNFGIFRKLFRRNSCTICLRFESFEIFGGMGGVQHCNMRSTVSLMVETLKI